MAEWKVGDDVVEEFMGRITKIENGFAQVEDEKGNWVLVPLSYLKHLEEPPKEEE